MATGIGRCDAGIGVRAASLVIDIEICFVMLAPLMLTPWVGAFRAVQWPLLVTLGPIWPFLYFSVSTRLWGGTPGKILLRLKIVDDDGERPTFLRILCREILKLLSIASAIGILVALAEIALLREPFYDKMCGTHVVRDSRAPSLLWDLTPPATGVLVLCGGCCIPIFWFSYPTVPYNLACDELRKNKAAIKHLGEPIGAGWAAAPHGEWDEDQGEATFEFPVAGSRMSGTATVEAVKRNGKWRIEHMHVDLAEIPQRVIVVERNKQQKN